MPVVPDQPQRGRSASGWTAHELPVEAAGIDEVAVVPWPLLVRFKRRVGGLSGPPTVSAGPWSVLAVALLGLFTVSITITLLAVSLVDIADDIGSDETTLSWIITGPMLAFGVVGPVFGKAGDIWGHKKVFLLGLAGAGIFAIATAFAWGAISLIVFRTLSASFGAATGPPAMAIINRLFVAEQRVKALGYFSFVYAGAPVLGVVIGGPLVEAVGWRVIFLVQGPLCFVALLVAMVRLPETERSRSGRFDVAGTVLLGGGITAILLAVNRGSDWGWTSPMVLAGFAVGILALPLFLSVERRAEQPLLPLSWLRRRNVVGPIASQFFANFAYMGGFVVTPVLLKQGLGYSTAFVGLLVIARPLAFSITAPTAGYVTVHVRERVAGMTGAAIVFVSMLLLAMIDGRSSAAFIALALASSGVGLGVSMPAMTAAVANAVSDEDLGVAAAMQQLMTQVGAVIGIQVMQTVQASTETTSGPIGSYANAYYVGAAAALVAVATAVVVKPTVPAEAARRGDDLAAATP